MDWDFWIIGFAIVLAIAVAYSLYGRARQTGISDHPLEERRGAPAAGGADDEPAPRSF